MLASGRFRASSLLGPALPESTSKWLGHTMDLRNSVDLRRLPTPAEWRNSSASILPQVAVENSPKVFVSYSIYKGKSACSIKPGRPVFKTRETGDFYLLKEGSVYMEFAPAVAQRQYDWNRKQIIALSVTELGDLIRLSPSETCEFFHDPFTGTSDAGKVKKVLKVEPIPDKSGFFFNFSVTNKINNIEERFNLPVTKGELAVMRSAFNFIIPYLIGWHAFADPLLVDQTLISDPSKPYSPLAARDSDIEWDRLKSY